MLSIKSKVFLIVLCTVLCSINNQLYAQRQDQTKSIKNLIGAEVLASSIDDFLTAQMLASKAPGLSLAIINDGKVVYHTVKGYADLKSRIEVTNKTLFEGASLSKPLFAYFVMGLVEDGKIDLDKPLYQYLPYEDIAHDERYKKITTRMVLSHTTGFPNWRSDNEEDKLTIEFEPGTRFSYSGEGYEYLTKVLKHIFGTDDRGLEKIFQERVAEPLELKYTKFVQNSRNLKYKAKGYKAAEIVESEDDPGVFNAAYSVHSEALDFSKWAIALLKQEGLSKQGYYKVYKNQLVIGFIKL